MTDDFGAPPVPEAAVAVADLASHNDTPRRNERPMRDGVPEPVSHYISTPEDSRQDENAPRKRSTVREKASFLFGGGKAESEVQSEQHASSSPAPANPETASAQGDAGDSDQPRRAGWWSKRSE